jgi:hypothetical protein
MKNQHVLVVPLLPIDFARENSQKESDERYFYAIFIQADSIHHVKVRAIPYCKRTSKPEAYPNQ